MSAKTLYRRLLLKYGLRCQDMAKELGITRASFSRWINTPTSIKLGDLIAMTLPLNAEEQEQVIRAYVREAKEKAAG